MRLSRSACDTECPSPAASLTGATPSPRIRVPSTSGHSSAWLERTVRDREVGGSNPLAPTISPGGTVGLIPVEYRRLASLDRKLLAARSLFVQIETESQSQDVMR